MNIRAIHPIINLADLDCKVRGHGERFEVRMGEIAPRIGAQKLGYNLSIVPPGKCAFPFHSHRVNEEMLFVVEGEGELRFGAARHVIRSGDVIACPPGGAEVAHQIFTSSTAELKLLAVSTRLSPEIVEYPDSGKFGLREGDADGTRTFNFNGRLANSLDYWDGE